jgi:hypothetical protein
MNLGGLQQSSSSVRRDKIYSGGFLVWMGVGRILGRNEGSEGQGIVDSILNVSVEER